MNDLEIAIKFINKWIFYCWNYDFVQYEWNGLGGAYRSAMVPRFLVEANWNCSFDHIYSKWVDVVSSTTAGNYSLLNFYAELSADNRRTLLEWVAQNYNDEQKI